MDYSKEPDQKIFSLIEQEVTRQQQGLILIPSENYASLSVIRAMGTPLSNKYSEGYPGKRYYSGNKFIDQIEELAIERAKKLFGFDNANVQPHSGSTANQAVILALLKPGDKILSLDLNHGGHLSHGSRLNFTGKFYNIASYGVEKDTEQLNYDHLEMIAKKEMPQLIISGSTSYPKQFDFDRVGQIAKTVGAFHLADIGHVAGLAVAGKHYPCQSADIVTTTTHKTLRGPRGAIILCQQELAEQIDRAVFPGVQGGPLENIIAAKAVCFLEARQPEFKIYAQQILDNALALAKSLTENDLRLVSGGTDTHLVLVDVRPLGIDGQKATLALENSGIYANKNVIPFETGTPFKPSGVRLGTPALTTRGMKEKEMEKIGSWISQLLHQSDDLTLQKKIKEEATELTNLFPVYGAPRASLPKAGKRVVPLGDTAFGGGT